MEREVQSDPLVLEGEDDLPRQPAGPEAWQPLPRGRHGDARSKRLVLMIVGVCVVAAIVLLLWALL
jgi:hypothetical protein